MMRMCFARQGLVFTLAIAIVWLGGNTASAAPIQFVATGVVDLIDAPLDSEFSIGDTFTMTYIFESTTIARTGSDSNFAFFDAIISQSFTLASYAGSATGPEEIQVDNDPGGIFNDRYSPGPGAGSVVTGPSVAGLNLSTFYFNLIDTTDTVFNDALVLPLSLSLADFTSATFRVEFIDDNDEIYVVSGQITSLVPEPSSLLLAVCGAMGAAVLVRRRRRS